MDESCEGKKRSKSIRSLSKSIQSLVGFNKNLTPGWVESVSRIIKDLSSAKPAGDSRKKGLALDRVENIGRSDAETDASVLKIRDELASLNAQLKQLNLEKRQALNDFLDLKGNIRVFCRIRPFLPTENCGYERSVLTSDPSNVFLRIAESKSKQYNFDKVFHQQSTQEGVFSEIEPVIKSALDGYNVCIFAYGQTGTGKTYTMEGTPDNAGVVQRGIEKLFQQASESNFRFQFTFSMLEIYMGNLRDLLVPKSKRLRLHKAPRLSIQMNPNGGIEIENLVAIKVSNYEQVERLYELGSRFRSTASTLANSTSSRSHCLIRMTLTSLGVPERRRETNKIWMVDLGGSERLLKTKASGRRLEEGKAINLSLSALGDVISALQSKKPHVPYRNSKLTQVLRDSLGSDSKTLMLVHVSPKEEDLCETICSLGFATRVRSICLESEEPTEERAKKEIAMSELLQKVKQLENERQQVRRDMESLNEKLRLLTRYESLDNCHLQFSYLSTEEMQSNGEINAQNVTDFSGTSASLPRYMRPTVSSQKKIDLDHQNFLSTRKKPPVPPKRRPASVYAESVTSRAKDVAWQSECGSEHSISTTSYMNWRNNTDDGTECSQGASDYEIKKVIFPEQEKSPRSLVTSLSQGSVSESESLQAKKIDQKKHLVIDSWLHLQMKEQISAHTHQGERVLANPIEKRSDRYNKRNPGRKNDQAEMLGGVNTRKQTVSKKHVNEFAKDLNFYDTTEQFGEAMPTEKSLKNMAMDGRDSFLADSLFDMTQTKYHNNKDYDQIAEKLKLNPEHQEEFTENTAEVEVDNESSVTQAQTPVSKENTISVESYTQDLCGSQQKMEDAGEPCLYFRRARRSLFTTNDLPTIDHKNAAMENPAVNVTSFKEEEGHTGNTGIHQQFQQTLQMLWASALLGLGIHSLGYGHDFFHGLMF
ncbi:kinesin-like protein KIN-14B [Phoenix dactylifera]|uniref:Kinesin-like protein KIN-14B n=1 Tax=Phoenix dactylifera TaxID=42345 RepID=A0A8B8J5Y8_PHODC|nr:kinesin-like protein KIN-14B [Phoenix dactylifera]XP_038988858.1 kinesin-like protein KIN-14B [Phoenix dactylifera]